MKHSFFNKTASIVLGLAILVSIGLDPLRVIAQTGGNSTVPASQLIKATTTPYAAYTTNVYGKNLYFPGATGTSTRWYADVFCIDLSTPDCISAWPTGGSGGGIATSSPWTVGNLVNVLDNGTITSIATSSLNISSTDILEGSNLFFTDERAQDGVGGIFADSSRIDFTYNDAGPSITSDIVADSIGDTQLAFNTGQALTTGSSPTFVALTLSGLSDGCLQSSTGLITSTGSACGSGSGGLATTTPWTIGDLVQVVDDGTVKSVATSSLGLPLFSTLDQYVTLAPATSTRNVITPTADSRSLVVRPYSSQTNDILSVEDNTGTNQYFYVDKDGYPRLGAKPQYTSGAFTYRDSNRLYFDYFFNGTRQNNYIEAVPNSPGLQNQAVLNFIVSGATQFQVSGVSGPGAPLGMTAGSFVIGAGGGSTIRTANTAAMLLRGEFNTVTLQGEYNTAGGYDTNFVGKNPFGGGTASNISGWFSDTTLVARVDPNGVFASRIGTSATLAKVGGGVNQSTTQTGNTAATETDLFTYTTPANSLATNGDSYQFEAAGTFANTANVDKRIKVKYGSTTILDTGALAIVTAQSWNVRGTVVRTGATTQKATVTITTSDGALVSTTSFSSPAETLSGTVILKLTGQGTGASDVVGEMWRVNWLPSTT